MPYFNNIFQNVFNFISTSTKETKQIDFSERFYSGGSDDVQKDVKRYGVSGIITFLDKNKVGRIDGFVNFDSTTVIIYHNKEKRMSVGSEVLMDIVRNSVTSPWYASKIEIINCPTVNISEDWDDFENTKSINSTLTAQQLPQKQVGMITYSYNDNLTINNEINFSQRDCGPNSFRPIKGDWVIVRFDHSVDQNRVIGISPLRYMDFEGCISALDTRTGIGYIEKQIYFNKSAGRTDQLKWGSIVYGTAIESVQGKRCNFRAITVFPSTNRNTANRGLKMRLRVSDKIDNRVKSPHKLGLNLNVSELNFGEQLIDKSISKEIVLTNKNDFPVTLVKIQLSSETNNQFIIEEVESINNYQLESNKSIRFSVKCMSQFPGFDCQDLSIEGFSENVKENWKINIRMSVYVNDPMVSEITEKITNGNGSVSPNKLLGTDQSMLERLGGIYLAAAVPVNVRSILTKVYPHKLKLYAVPQELETRVEEISKDHSKIDSHYPVLKQKLNAGNYAEVMNLLVHLEEINTKQEMKQFVLENVRLMPRRDTFGIEVPGLSEGRPSLVVGDKVNVTIHRSGAACYSGSIDDIIRDCIFVRFHSLVHSHYTNEECTVTFTHSRLPFRRMHLGIEVARGILGDSLIFPPSKIERKKPSQCMRLSRCGRNEISAINFEKEESTNRLKLNFYNKSLNELQRVAVLRIVHGYSRPLPYVLFGPPGTGKTVTLVESILQTYKNVPSSRLLVCAPSNSAADLICLRLDESGVVETGEMVRMNAYRRTILSEISDKEPIPARVLPYCKSVEELSEIAMHRIIICTCISSGALYRLGLQSGHITHVFVDEAGQASEPEIMVSLGLVSPDNGQIILAGDPMQLGPVIRSPFAQRLQDSYLHRLLLSCELYKRHDNVFPGSSTHFNPLVVTQLLNNYRAHPSLLKLPSDMFYEGTLIPCADKTRFVNWKWLPNPEIPLIFHGVRGKELRNPKCPSTYNPSEAVMVVRWIGRLLQDVKSELNLEDSNISVITPYRAQVDCIRRLIRNCLEDVNLAKLKVASVEEFQGQENEVVIISTVRSSLEESVNGGVHESFAIVDTISSRLGFLSNERRFNVAITRACSLLIVIGDPGLLQYDECWKKLINYAKKKGAYLGSDL